MVILTKRQYLTQLRSKANLSQQSVADETGLSQQYYAFIENGERQKDMSLSVMKKLAAVFGVPVEQIMELETEYQQAQSESEAV